MHELYELAMNAYKSNDERLFIASVINWLDNAKENPFAENTQERQLFFRAKRYCMKWRAGGIDMRSSKRNMVEMARQIMDLNIENPYIVAEEKEIVEIPVKEEPKEEVAILNEDVQQLMAQMVDAYNKKDNSSYETYVTRLMGCENPFLIGSDEYGMFSTMKACYTHNPPNKRRTFVVGKQLCDLINNTEIEPEKPKETVLGVIPDEKKSWFKFLFPWKREGESDDGTGID